MKKVVVLSAVAAAVMMAGAANAAEIYNKDGNKLDLYGKVDGLHYFSSNHFRDTLLFPKLCHCLTFIIVNLFFYYFRTLLASFFIDYSLAIRLRSRECAFCYCHLSALYLNDKRGNRVWTFER